MKKVINYVALLLIVVTSQLTFAHGGEDHGDAKPKGHVAGNTYFSSEANSDKYELFLKYKPLKSGDPAIMQLFVSDFNTNKPISKASIIVTSDDENLKFTVTPSGEGMYTIKTKFPSNKEYDLNISINSDLGPDLMEISGIAVGKELPKTDEAVKETKSFFDNTWVMFAIGFIAALLFMFGLMKLKSKKINATLLSFIILFSSLPLQVQKTYAHGGEDHGDENGKKSGGNFSNTFVIPKETQFLFDIYTQKLGMNDFSTGTKLFGTVIPSSAGAAVVTSPQNGRVTSLKVNVGQQVVQGQILAVIEQNIEASSQVNLLAEKNRINAEFEAAKNQYQRMKTIQDIASKKDFSEAEARYQQALGNKKLFNSSTGRTIVLKAPIGGTVGNFTYTVGASINTGETIFTITNLSKVYIEAQVFDKDASKLNTGGKYTIEGTNDATKQGEVKLIQTAQNINASNQSQRVLFEMYNKEGVFKIGEFVNINVFASQTTKQIAVPNSAISEIGGKSVVFVKDSAEQYSVSYVTVGESNGKETVINKGIEEGERVVINGTYQLKMIFLNQ